MAHTITNSTQANLIDMISYTPSRASGPQGAKVINIINVNTKKNLRLKTPFMATFGASDFKEKGTDIGDGKFSMSLIFGNEPNQDEDVFLKNMIELEQKIKDDALLNDKEWFGKSMKHSDVVDALWTPMVKYPWNKETLSYDNKKKPTLRIKLAKYEDWNFEIYDEQQRRLLPDVNNPSASPTDFLKLMSVVGCVIEFSGIWFVNSKFSATWKLVQVMVKTPPESIVGRCFINLDSETDNRQDSQMQSPPAKTSNEQSLVMVEDSDEDEPADQSIDISQIPVENSESIEVVANIKAKKGKVAKKNVA